MENILNMREDNYLFGFQRFLHYLKTTRNVNNFTIVEIGAYTGQSTTMFADIVKQVITIDPFLNGYADGDLAARSADLPTTVYQKFLERTTPYTNIKHIKKTSDDAIEELNDLQVDLVYIDGAHTYEQVVKDINNYRRIVKPGGLLCGHDYEPSFQGVIDAVNESIGTPRMIFEDFTWVTQL